MFLALHCFLLRYSEVPTTITAKRIMRFTVVLLKGPGESLNCVMRHDLRTRVRLQMLGICLPVSDGEGEVHDDGVGFHLHALEVVKPCAVGAGFGVGSVRLNERLDEHIVRRGSKTR